MRIQWCHAAGIDPATLVTVHQIHGATVRVAGAADVGHGAQPGSETLGQADAIITREPGVALMTLHADCMPILLYDPETPAVASIHAGWRGTTEDVAGATVAAMQREFGSRPEQLRAFLGAAIGRCCYEVGDEVVAAWRDQAGDEGDTALDWTGPRWHLDLRAANRLLLVRAGLSEELIDVSDICTRCQPDEWFSHRGQGPLTGRFAALIALREQE
jgi:YfiH family protein